MPIYALNGIAPKIAADVFVAPGAQIIGDVEIGPQSSVWFNCLVRGDGNDIRIGARTNIQDGTIVHVTTKLHRTRIGDDVLIGHMAIVHGCQLHDRSFVGMGAIVMDGCVIESDAMLAAGAMLTPGKRILSGQLWAGRPAKFVRDLSSDEFSMLRRGVETYTDLAQVYRTGLVEVPGPSAPECGSK
jgi:gamma-carbonic anhydrase